MIYHTADSMILGFLGRSLSFEMSGVQAYRTQSKLVERWGFPDVADKLSEQSSQSLAHTDRIIGRMLAMGVAPNASQLRPAHLGGNVKELLERNHSFCQELMMLYTKAIQHAISIQDFDSAMFFDNLLSEEKASSDSLSEMLHQFQTTA